MSDAETASALFDELASARSTIAEQEKRIAELEAERDRALRFREHTEQWYAERLEPIRDVAKRVGVWDEVAAIIANGSGTRQVGGKYIYEPPTYAQQLNAAKYRAETAEQALTTERQRREEAETALRPFARNAAAMWFRNADPTTGVETSLCTGADEECLFSIGELAGARAHFAKYFPPPPEGKGR